MAGSESEVLRDREVVQAPDRSSGEKLSSTAVELFKEPTTDRQPPTGAVEKHGFPTAENVVEIPKNVPQDVRDAAKNHVPRELYKTEGEAAAAEKTYTDSIMAGRELADKFKELSRNQAMGKSPGIHDPEFAKEFAEAVQKAYKDGQVNIKTDDFTGGESAVEALTKEITDRCNTPFKDAAPFRLNASVDKTGATLDICDREGMPGAHRYKSAETVHVDRFPDLAKQGADVSKQISSGEWGVTQRDQLEKQFDQELKTGNEEEGRARVKSLAKAISKGLPDLDLIAATDGKHLDIFFANKNERR